MNKVVKAWRAIYNGFMPVSQIKGTFIVIIGLYLFFLADAIKDDFSTERWIDLQSRQEGGNIVFAGIKHLVPYVITNASVKFEINNSFDLIMLSNRGMNESLLTAVLKLITAILALKLLWSFDFNDPFNLKHYKRVNFLGWLCTLILFADYFRDYYTWHWFDIVNHGTSGFKHDTAFNVFFLIAGIWIFKAITSCYQKAVRTQQEAALTI